MIRYPWKVGILLWILTWSQCWNRFVCDPAATYGIWIIKTEMGDYLTTDVGLENRIFLKTGWLANLIYYDKETYGILVGLTIPAYFGNGLNTKEIFNAAKVQNKGFEFSLGWRDQVGKLKYNIGINGNDDFHNKIIQQSVEWADRIPFFTGESGHGQLCDCFEGRTSYRGFFTDIKPMEYSKTQAELNAIPAHYGWIRCYSWFVYVM